MSGFKTAVQVLTRGEKHRVWSLVVTIFGDLAQEKGAEINAQTLGKLTEQIGVKSEALRVALHRLKKDGWIQSTRHGRSSTYSLTEFGHQQTVSASPRIYAKTDPENWDWSLYLTPSNTTTAEPEISELIEDGSLVRLSNSATLGRSQNLKGHPEILQAIIDPKNVPTWVKALIFDEAICVSYDALLASLQEATRHIPNDVSPLESAVLRTLIVHSWRKVLLRHADVPADFCPKDCKALEVKKLVVQLLDALPKPLITELAS